MEKDPTKPGLLTSFDEIDAYVPENELKKMNPFDLLMLFQPENDYDFQQRINDPKPKAVQHKPEIRFYNGVLYDSKEEAAFAKFLDAMNFDWRYLSNRQGCNFLVNNWRYSNQYHPRKVYILAWATNELDAIFSMLERKGKKNILFFDFEQIDCFYEWCDEINGWAYYQLPTYEIDYADSIQVKFRENISILDM